MCLCDSNLPQRQINPHGGGNGFDNMSRSLIGLLSCIRTQTDDDPEYRRVIDISDATGDNLRAHRSDCHRSVQCLEGQMNIDGLISLDSVDLCWKYVQEEF